jgi:outer membrane lipoprotein-sorting protein
LLRKSPEFLPIAVRAFLMRRLVLLVSALASLVLLPGAAPAPQRLYESFSDAQRADLARVSAYLNGIHSLKAAFVQIGPQGGIDQGELYIQKPGQIRFEYRAPSPILIVATAGRVYVKNARLNTVDRYSLSDTPLPLLLDDTVDLGHSIAVTGVGEGNGVIIVTARTNANRNKSDITIVFSAADMQLRQWTVKDNQGGNTTVALQNLEVGAAIDPALFAVPTRNAPVRPAPSGN